MTQLTPPDGPLEKSDVESFVTRIHPYLDHHTELSEAETKNVAITPFLSMLEWELLSNGRMEYAIGDYSSKNVDYAFFNETDDSVLFVEAKRYGSKLKQKHRNQLKEYLLLDNADWGILTNGAEYEFFYRTTNGNNVETLRIEHIDLDELPEYTPLLNIVAKPTILSEESIGYGEVLVGLANAKHELTERQDELLDSIVELVENEVGSVAHEPAKDVFDTAITQLQEKLQLIDGESEDINSSTTEHSDTSNLIENESQDNSLSVDDAQQLIEVIRGKDESRVIKKTLAVDDQTQELVNKLDAFVRSLGSDVERNITTSYFGYKRNGTVFASFTVKPQKREIGLALKLDPNNTSLPDFGRDLTSLTYSQPGDFLLEFSDESQLDIAKDYVEQAYNKQSPTEESHGVHGIVDDTPIETKAIDTLDASDDNKVGIFPSHPDGVDFIRKYNAWGFISIAQEPDYFMIYVTKPVQELKYIGSVKDIIPESQFIEETDFDERKRDPDDPEKMVIEFDNVYELEEPITQDPENPTMIMGLKYTTFGDVRAAETTNDL